MLPIRTADLTPLLRASCLAAALAIAALAPVVAPAALADSVGEAVSNGGGLMSGTWESGRDKDRDQLWMSFRNDGPGGSRNQHWTRIEADEIEGLDLRSLTSGRREVEFRVKRDAGTIRATGEFAGSKGEGTFTLELDPAFASELSRRGVGRPTEAEHAQLLLAGAGYGLLDALAREKYATPRVAMLVRMARHGVDAD